jgi:putative OPT family oligopeptide transporter
MMQDLKVGHILGGTPWRMQVGELIGVVVTSFVLIFPLILLHQAYPGGIGGDDLPAPQAGLMAMMANGIVGGEMAWPLVLAGMLFSVGLILIKSPSPMIIAVGMYLPFNTTAAIFLGGIIRYILLKRAEKKVKQETDQEKVENTGILLASGLIAGEALMGIILAIFVTAEEIVSFKLPSLVDSATGVTLVLVSLLSVVVVLVLAYILIKIPLNALQKK